MELFGITIRTAKSLRKKLDEVYSISIDINDNDHQMYWLLEGAYNSRIFGLCFYRSKGNTYYDDRIIIIRNKRTNT